MSDIGTSSSSPFLRKRTTVGKDSMGRDAEVRVFGPRFQSGLAVPRNKQISLQGFVLSGFAIVVTAGIMFLLGVNIVIEYRTIVPEDRSGMVRKACFIVLSVAGIYILNKFNYWFYRRMMAYFTNTKYEGLPSHEEQFEMSSRA
ncbi:LAFA_0A05138g1_1 [Lachancea sp. 'fantastica']|nr:LAFA_0A05138g1_1 [Lachancea sp. 'fantastica']